MIKSKQKRKHGISKKEQAEVSKNVEDYIQSIQDKDFEYLRIGYDFYWPTSNLNQDKNDLDDEIPF